MNKNVQPSQPQGQSNQIAPVQVSQGGSGKGCPACGSTQKITKSVAKTRAVIWGLLCFPFGLIACCVCKKEVTKCGSCGVTLYQKDL